MTETPLSMLAKYQAPKSEQKFTKHAMDRTKTRNMSEHICRKVIDDGKCEIKRSATSGKMRRVYSNAQYKVVVDMEDKNVITVMDKKPKFIPNSAFGNYKKKRDRLGMKSR